MLDFFGGERLDGEFFNYRAGARRPKGFGLRQDMCRIWDRHVPAEGRQLYAFGVGRCESLGLPLERLVVFWVNQNRLFQFAAGDWWSNQYYPRPPQYPLEVRFASKDDAKVHGAARGRTSIPIDLGHRWGPVQSGRESENAFYAVCSACNERVRVYGLSDRDKKVYFGLNIFRTNTPRLDLRDDHGWQALPCMGTKDS